MSEMHGLHGTYRVEPRAADLEALRGREFAFRPGPAITLADSIARAGELAMIPQDPTYPADAPPWIPSGDLVFVAEKAWPKLPSTTTPELPL